MIFDQISHLTKNFPTEANEPYGFIRRTIFGIFIIITFFASLFVQAGEDVDPFVRVGGDVTPDVVEQPMSKWEDQVIDLTKEKSPGYVRFGGGDSIRIFKNSVKLTFTVDKKEYEEALKHSDTNRGVILISGDLKAPETYCWIRPLMLSDAEAVFILTVPLKSLKEMYCAFIPKDGNRRFVYNLATVVERFGKHQ